jgi:hypothetical protein
VDTTYVTDDPAPPQQKRVLLEEYTGVRCVNCPAGHEEIHRLDSLYGKQVVALSIHAGDFAVPYDYSDEDFAIDAGESVHQLVGPASAYPAADIDRFLYSGESEVIVDELSKWSTYFDRQKQKTPPVNLSLQDTFVNQTLKVQATLEYTRAVQDENRLTIAVIENDIEDPQLTPDGVDTFYHHEYVMRDILTPYNGVSINPPKEPGRIVKKGFRMSDFSRINDLKNSWVVGFVHHSGDSLNVLQAAETKID